MTKYLLDTNIISELGKPEPQKSVIEFLSDQPVAWLSTITLHELEYGLALLPEGNRSNGIQSIMAELISRYSAYIIPISQAEAQQAALLRAMMEQQGKVLHLADSLIAGTAKVHHLTVATRNVKDFEGLGIELFDPFASNKH